MHVGDMGKNIFSTSEESSQNSIAPVQFSYEIILNQI